MQVETRTFKDKDNKEQVTLVLIPSNEAESKLIDKIGDQPFDEDGVGPSVVGEICLSDGYGQHYIRLRSAK